MRKVTGIILCSFLTVMAYSQQVFFIYIQSEGRQPFYVKISNKTLSSTASGYLVIPKLAPGEYKLKAGFPRSSNSELDFLCRIADKDLGYSLKSFGEKGWGLFNLQNYDVQMAGSVVAAQAAPGSNYSDLLAQVVKDPSVKDVKAGNPPPAPKIADTVARGVKNEPLNTAPVTASPEKQVVEPKQIVDTVAINPVPAVEKPEQMPAAVVKNEPVITPPVTAAPEKLPVQEKPAATPPDSLVSRVNRLLSSPGTDGVEAVYQVKTGVETDTIRIFIPVLKAIPAPPPVVQLQADTVAVKPDNKEGKFLDFGVKNPGVQSGADTILQKPAPPVVETQLPAPKPVSADTVGKAVPGPVTPAADTVKKPANRLIMFNTDCRKIAGEDDFIKLRKTMAGERTDEDMVDAARKAFKQRCYLLQHIRALSGLLTTDAARYSLFDAAYAHTYDTEDYKTLGSLLKDSYYIERFNVMVRK